MRLGGRGIVCSRPWPALGCSRAAAVGGRLRSHERYDEGFSYSVSLAAVKQRRGWWEGGGGGRCETQILRGGHGWKRGDAAARGMERQGSLCVFSAEHVLCSHRRAGGLDGETGVPWLSQQRRGG